MRYLPLIAALLTVSGCSSGSSQSATLTLNDPIWDRINVQVVITKSSDCDERRPPHAHGIAPGRSLGSSTK